MSLLTETSKKSFKFEYQVNFVEAFSLLVTWFFLFVFPHDRAVSCRPSPTLWWRSLSPLAASWRTNSDSDSWPPPRSEKYSTVEVILLKYIFRFICGIKYNQRIISRILRNLPLSPFGSQRLIFWIHLVSIDRRELASSTVGYRQHTRLVLVFVISSTLLLTTSLNKFTTILTTCQI